MLILFALMILFSFMEFFFRKFQVKSIFFVLAGTLLILIQSFNTYSPDLDSYRIHFEFFDDELIRAASEPIHLKIIDISHLFNLDFKSFVILYGLLIFIPFLMFLQRSTPLPAFVLALFFIIPFFPDISQLRNFMAFAIFFLALTFYNTKRIVFYILYIISILCHFSMLAFLVFFLLKRFSFFRNYKKSTLIIIIGMSLLSMVPKSISEPLLIAINPKYGTYIGSTGTYFGTIALFLPFFILNSAVLYHYNYKYPEIKQKISELDQKRVLLFVELILFSNFIILLQYFIRDFNRITMNLSILSYVYISIMIFYGWSRNTFATQLHLVRLGLFVWMGLTFYIVFLALNDGEYFEIINKTFLSNSFYGN